MDTKLRVARALSSRIAWRVLRLAAILAAVLFAVLFGGTWALAYFFSSWWWLLLVPIVFVAVVFLIVRLVVSFITSGIYRQPLTRDQKNALDNFIGKVQQLVEAKSTPPIFFLVVSIKDILFHKDVTTIKKLIKDSTSLRADYRALEKLF